MAKLTEAQKNQIQIEYAAGASTRELAEKFSVSQTAIAKLLKSKKSVQKQKKCSDSDDDSDQQKLSNRESAQNIVSKAYDALLNRDYSKVNPETLLKIIERFSAIYGKEELENYETDAVTSIRIEIEDASGDGDEG